MTSTYNIDRHITEALNDACRFIAAKASIDADRVWVRRFDRTWDEYGDAVRPIAQQEAGVDFILITSEGAMKAIGNQPAAADLLAFFRRNTDGIIAWARAAADTEVTS